MSRIQTLQAYGRFALGLPGYLRKTITIEEAQAIVRRRLAEREDNFLRLAEQSIYRFPASPYRTLLRWAGCELGDLQSMVRSQGLEGALQALHQAGVYITFEEFKGRQPIRRGSQVLPVQAHNFDNPCLRRYIEGETGGSTGGATRVAIDLQHLADQAPLLMLSYSAHGLLHAPTAMWWSVLPSGAGINTLLHAATFRYTPEKWFTPVTGADLQPALKYRVATQYIIAMGRLMGLPFPSPQPLRLDQAEVLARWAVDTVKARGRCLIRAHVSTALRVCVAAQKAGLDLTGASIVGGGEPPTPAKVRQITRTGAHWVPNYFCAEAGVIGWGCANPADQDDNHFFRDKLALIQRPRTVPDTDITVNAFSFTSLLLSAPKVMLNVEIDDYGVLEERSCGCPLESAGFTQHLRHIYSFSKLTGEGMSLVGSEMVRILEEVLPARFGGSALDYQLLEEEDEQGFTRLSLLVSERVHLADEAEVIGAVLDALRETSASADLARAIWTQASTLRVRRREPIWTSRGKLMPLHLDRQRRGD